MSGSDVSWPWTELGLKEIPETAREVRRAYAARLKEKDWSGDPSGFSDLRRAYEYALSITGDARQRRSIFGSENAETQPWDDDPPPAEGMADDEGKAPHEAAPDLPEPAPVDPAVEEEMAARRAAEEAAEELLRSAGRLLKLQNYEATLWNDLLASPLLDDPIVRRQFERSVLDHVERYVYVGASNAVLNWLAQMDGEFGWTADSIGFLRRHPYQDELQAKILLALGDRRSINAAPVLPQKKPPFKTWQVLFPAAVVIITFIATFVADSPSADQISFYLFASLIGGFGMVFLFALVSGLLSWLVSAVTRFSDRGTRFVISARRWWGKPLKWIEKGVALRFVIAIIPALIMLPAAFSGDWRPTITGSSISEERSRMNTYFSIATDAVSQGTTEIAALPYPHFAPTKPVMLGEIEPDDPFQADSMIDWNASMQVKVFSDRPIALLECDGPAGSAESVCELGARSDQQFLREITIEKKLPIRSRMTSALSHPGIVLILDEQNRLTAYWRRDFDTDRDLKLSWFAGENRYGRLYTVSFRTYDAAVLTDSGSYSLVDDRGERIPVSLPVEDLLHPIRLRLIWPADGIAGAVCGTLDGATTEIMPCDMERGDISYGETLICANLHNANDCTTRYDGNPLTFDPPDMMPVLQDLLMRMKTTGPHEPLPDTALVRGLRDQVLNDYALILDRPGMAAHRRDKDALTAALIRQPHLQIAYEASPDIRDRIWQHLIGQLQDLGFPGPFVETVPDLPTEDS
ncbi:hypothetical protein JJJ17_16335 [Paracoccus caeni]|uniref:Uncharacterized protein n=1 Tax=Paracoccus caeni TaxID=657651 RepID=A0A934W278_9RHOB|nr:hypothetical protein [Paracoccus caeni]MBK4217499.1 hypothetical protein [Paracoccus caeni]